MVEQYYNERILPLINFYGKKYINIPITVKNEKYKSCYTIIKLTGNYNEDNVLLQNIENLNNFIGWNI